MRAYVFEGGREVEAGPRPAGTPSRRPRLSCLMITRDRPEQARLALWGFAAQTYPNREIVIVDDGRETDFSAVLQSVGLPSEQVRYVKAPAGLSLGELRNLSVAEATGEYVCTWDDDDLHDPLRLALQYGVLQQSGARASFLYRVMIWWPQQGWLGASKRFMWDNTMMCERAVLPSYPPLSRGEDTPVTRALIQQHRVATFDEPRLYCYVGHRTNASGAAHFAANWAAATIRFSGEDYESTLVDLGARLPISAYRELLEDMAIRPLKVFEVKAPGS